ncbi:hypothetical protein EDB85DRAFT_350688 [Lactarius pseudohatsudake]|nr:hypothetical protein EDB85DRAFT_350688 [Lactarius pseudohatsudake]
MQACYIWHGVVNDSILQGCSSTSSSPISSCLCLCSSGSTGGPGPPPPSDVRQGCQQRVRQRGLPQHATSWVLHPLPPCVKVGATLGPQLSLCRHCRQLQLQHYLWHARSPFVITYFADLDLAQVRTGAVRGQNPSSLSLFEVRRGSPRHPLHLHLHLQPPLSAHWHFATPPPSHRSLKHRLFLRFPPLGWRGAPSKDDDIHCDTHRARGAAHTHARVITRTTTTRLGSHPPSRSRRRH